MTDSEGWEELDPNDEEELEKLRKAFEDGASRFQWRAFKDDFKMSGDFYPSAPQEPKKEPTDWNAELKRLIKEESKK